MVFKKGDLVEVVNPRTSFKGLVGTIVDIMPDTVRYKYTVKHPNNVFMPSGISVMFYDEDELMLLKASNPENA